MLSLLMAISGRFRARRMKRFLRYCSITSETRILDVGGVPDFWDLIPGRPFIVLLNLTPPNRDLGRAAYAVVGDGKSIPFNDCSFDVVVSNSAIEHVGDRHAQECFAKEVMRVGKSHWVQTPNLWFPIEQHLFLPLIHWLPRRWQIPIVRRFTLWSVMRVPQSHRNFFVDHYLSEIRLLCAAELQGFSRLR